MLLNLIGCVFVALTYFGVVTFPSWIVGVTIACAAIGLIEVGLCVKKGGTIAMTEGIVGALALAANLFFLIKIMAL